MAYIGLVLTALSAVQQYRAGQKAEAAGEENARRIRAETEEKARRTKKGQEAKMGTARARAAASGTADGGSQDIYMSEMEKEFGIELDWLRASGAGQAESAKRGGQVARQQATAGAIGSMASAFGTAYGQGLFKGTGSSSLPATPFQPYGK